MNDGFGKKRLLAANALPPPGVITGRGAVFRSNLFLYASVLAISAVVGAARYEWLGSYPTATSSDAGNWLTLARITLGDTWLNTHVNHVWPFGQLELYNLLAPWIPVLPLSLLVSALGGEEGLKLFMLLASVLPLPAAFFLLRQLKLGPIQSLLVSVVFISIPQNATSFAWGNYDGLFGLSFALVALGLVVRLLERPTRRLVASTALFIALTAGSDAMFFVFITVSLAMIFVFQALRRAENCKQLLLALAAGLAASSPFAPVYIDIWLSRSAHASAMGNPLLFASQVYSDYIATPLRSAWPFLVGLLVVSVAYLVYAAEGRHRVVIVTTALASVLVDYFFFYYRPVRFWYMVDVPALVLFGLFYRDVWSWARNFRSGRHPLAVKVTTIFLLLLLVASVAQLGYLSTTSAYRFYSDMDGQKLGALSWLGSNVPPTSVVLSSADTPNSPHLDYWISGLAGRLAVGEEYAFLPNSPDLTFASEYQRAHLAALALKGNLILENGMVMAADSFPYHSPFRPLVAMYVGDYQPVAYLAWEKASFAVAGSRPGAPPMNVSLDSFRQLSNFTPAQTQDSASVSYGYSYGVGLGPTVLFNETVNYGNPTVYLSLSWQGRGLNLLQAEELLYFVAPVVPHSQGGPNATFSVVDKFGDSIEGSINATSNGGATEVDFHSYTNSTYASVRFLAGTSQSPVLRIALSFDVARNPQKVDLQTFASIRSLLHFDYVVVVNRWWYELDFISSVGTPVYSNSEVTIFSLPGPGGRG